jgi:hypothetical protein
MILSKEKTKSGFVKDAVMSGSRQPDNGHGYVHTVKPHSGINRDNIIILKRR